MRTVELHLEEERLRPFVSTKGRKAVDDAVGYLARWASDSFPVVKIYHDLGHDLVAVYYDAEGQRRYVIGAVWRENEYTFHS